MLEEPSEVYSAEISRLVLEAFPNDGGPDIARNVSGDLLLD